MVCAGWKQHATADGTILSLLGVILGAYVRCMFGTTSLAQVLTAFKLEGHLLHV